MLHLLAHFLRVCVHIAFYHFASASNDIEQFFGMLDLPLESVSGEFAAYLSVMRRLMTTKLE